MILFKRALPVLLVVVAGFTYSLAGQAPTPPPAAIFTAAQAQAGQASYQTNCASCHLADLAGQNEAPQLAGTNFRNTWRTRTTKDLIELMAATMPPGRPSLAEADYVNIAAFILRANGAPAGTNALTSAMTTAVGAVATGQAVTTAVADDPSVAV